MDKKLQQDILKALSTRSYVFELRELQTELLEKYGHTRETEGHLDVFSSKVMNILNVLSKDGLVISQTGQTGNLRMSTFYSLTASGYELFGPWYKRVGSFFSKNSKDIIIALSTTLLGFILGKIF